jgi:iron complex outermembrane receptor protein
LGIELTSKHISLALSGFYNHINNFIYLSPQDSLIDGVQIFEYTQTDASLYGFETTIDIHPHAMHWLHFETQYAMVIGKRKDGTYLPRIPANNLQNTLKANLKDIKFIKKPFMSVSVKTVFKQNNIDAFETETLTYLLLNASIGGDLKIAKQIVELSFGVTNLLDKKYTNHLSRLKQDGIYNMGRNFVVNLRIPFEFKKS